MKNLILLKKVTSVKISLLVHFDVYNEAKFCRKNLVS